MHDVLHWLIQPDLAPLLRHGQIVFLVVVGTIVFAETGLLFGFLLPGDSLLFSAGLVAALGGAPNPLILASIVFVAAFAGDQVGYLIGRKSGPSLYRRQDGRIFRREYMERSKAFFERHGGRAIVLARFVPVVRTFTPVVAGVSQMPYRHFVTYNAIGALGWGVCVTMLGFVLGKRFPGMEHVLTPVLIAIVALSLLPAAWQVFRRQQTAGARPHAHSDH